MSLMRVSIPHPWSSCLDFRTARTVGTSFVQSRIDYCISMYYCLPQAQLNCLQHTSKMLLLMPLLQLPSSQILTIFSNRCNGSRYKNALNTKLFPPHCSFSLLLHITCMILSQSSLLDHAHWSLFFNHQLTPVSRSQTALSDMLHLIWGTGFLRLFVFLISSILHHHSALLRRYALILERLLTFLAVFSTILFKLFFSQSLYLHIRLIPSSSWPIVVWQSLAAIILVSATG